MSTFYGTLRGKARTIATRCGSRGSGITTTAASWKGAVVVRMYTNDNGTELFEVVMAQWHGHGDYKVIASGVVGDARSIEMGTKNG